MLVSAAVVMSMEVPALLLNAVVLAAVMLVPAGVVEVMAALLPAVMSAVVVAVAAVPSSHNFLTSSSATSRVQ